MQRYSSFAGFRHREIIELNYYLGMPIETAIACTTMKGYLKIFRDMRDFLDYRKYGQQSFIYKDHRRIFLENNHIKFVSVVLLVSTYFIRDRNKLLNRHYIQGGMVMFSYTVCTGLAIALGLIVSTFVLGFIMSTKWYASQVAKITRRLLLNDEYTQIMKEFGKRATDIAIDTVSDEHLDDVKLNVSIEEDVA